MDQTPTPLRIVTRCESLNEFVAFFGPLADEQSIFLVTDEPPPLGARHPFKLQLPGGEPLLQGEGEVIESRPTAFRWRFIRLDEPSKTVHSRLVALRDVGALPPEADAMQVTIHEETGLWPGAVIPSSGVEVAWPASPPFPTDVQAGPVIDQPMPRAPSVPSGAFGETPAPEVRRPRDQFSTGDEKAWFDDLAAPGGVAPAKDKSDKPAAAPPRAPITNRDEGFAEPVSGLRRSLPYVAGASVLATGLGILIGFVIWGGKQAPSPLVAAAAPAESRPAGAATPDANPVPVVAPVVAPGATRMPSAGGALCRLAVRSTPSRATVSIGREERGETPADLELPCDVAVTVVLERARYERVERTVTPTQGTMVTVDERLARPEAMLEVASTPAGAVITVAGARAGKTPASVKVPAYTAVQVTATLDGYKPWSKKVYVKGRKMKVSAKLAKRK